MFCATRARNRAGVFAPGIHNHFQNLAGVPPSGGPGRLKPELQRNLQRNRTRASSWKNRQRHNLLHSQHLVRSLQVYFYHLLQCYIAPYPSRSPPPPAAQYDDGMGYGRRLTLCLATTAAFSLLALLYAAGYFCLLVIHYPPQRVIVNEATGQTVYLGQTKTTADYRVGGNVAKSFFAPPEALDRKLRPSLWHPIKLLKDAGLVGATAVASPSSPQDELPEPDAPERISPSRLMEALARQKK